MRGDPDQIPYDRSRLGRQFPPSSFAAMTPQDRPPRGAVVDFTEVARDQRIGELERAVAKLSRDLEECAHLSRCAKSESNLSLTVAAVGLGCCLLAIIVIAFVAEAM